MRISVPLEINISEEMKSCGAWKTVNSSNELIEPHQKKIRSNNAKHAHVKKSKNSRSARLQKKLSEIEEEDKGSAVRMQSLDEDESEFITIKIDNPIAEDDAGDVDMLLKNAEQEDGEQEDGQAEDKV